MEYRVTPAVAYQLRQQADAIALHFAGLSVEERSPRFVLRPAWPKLKACRAWIPRVESD